jgi:FtsP/CotA-like multicopper oxidase with cupredoxin domain
VIEADATPVLPVQVDRFPIAVAQRYSVIVEANQTASNYWLRAMMSTGCFNEANPVLNPLVSAVIHYDGAPEEMPTSTDWSEAYEQDCVDLNNDDLEPYFSMAAPEQDVRYNLEFQFNMGGNGITLAYINGTSWMADTTQSSLQIANNASANNGVAAFPSNQLVLTPTANQTVVDIVLNSELSNFWSS